MTGRPAEISAGTAGVIGAAIAAFLGITDPVKAAGIIAFVGLVPGFVTWVVELRRRS